MPSKFGFPTEVVGEGAVQVVVPKLEAYIKESWEYAPSKAPVFYNPVMELNRDLAVLALQAYRNIVKRKISVCEPLAGCGVRGIRFAIEVEGVRKVILNDISPKAFKLATYNVKLNKLADRVFVENTDANLLLSKFGAPRKRFDFIDVDPFGSPVPYIDSALRALRSGGLLALTATDMAPLCGVHPRACIRKYGGKPLRTEYCHEIAVRLLAGCLTMTAAKQDIGVNIVFSHSTNHYIRIYAVINYGAKKADKSILKMGYIRHCFSCLHRETRKGIFSPVEKECPECGKKMSAAGPLWLGELIDEKLCTCMEKEANKRSLRQKKRIYKLLSTIRGETKAPITYYVVDAICDKYKLQIPPFKKIIKELEKQGYKVFPTHFKNGGLKTNAPSKEVVAVIARLTRK